MGETLGHLAFLFVGMVIGAIILFLFCFIGGQCRFMSPGYWTPQSNLTCSVQASACNCTAQGAGTTTTTCFQKGSSCSSNSDCCQGLICADGTCLPETCINSPNCTGGNCCQNTPVGCGLSGYTPCYSNTDCCSGLTCVNSKCTNQTTTLLCSQITPASASDCHRGTCSGGTCRYVGAVHEGGSPEGTVTRNARCVCDTCNSTDEGSMWVQGSCSNGTITHTDYCENDSTVVNSLCKPYNVAYYLNGTTGTSKLLYADYGVDDALSQNATIVGADITEVATAPFIGSCYVVDDYCTAFYGPNTICRNGACVNITCKTSGTCSADSDCCTGYQCNDQSCSSTTTCTDTSLTCANSLDCCPGDYCHYDNTCHSYSCNSLGEACEANSECCSPYACVSGHCSTPATCQTSGRCNTDTDCCNYSYCNSNFYCTACMTAGICTKNSACCSGYCSNSGMCAYTACKRTGGACSANSDCCYGLSCSNGACMPS